MSNQKYRPMLVGEVVKKGDQFLNYFTGEWENTKYASFRVKCADPDHYRTSRPLPKRRVA